MPENNQESHFSLSQSFDIQQFLPFRLARLATEVSQSLAQIYSQRFDINIPEWRVLATLGDREPVTAQEIVASTRTHKSTISRAVDTLAARGWIERFESAVDRRENKLRFTKLGREKFSEILPLVFEFETQLMEQMSRSGRKQLNAGIAEMDHQSGHWWQGIRLWVSR